MDIPLTPVISTETQDNDCELYMLREDLRGLQEGGNKYFKLKYNLEEARRCGYSQVLSFGGAYSNHIAALAAAGHRLGIKTIGVIRGHEGTITTTLQKATENGMQLHFMSREDYRKKESPEIEQMLKEAFGDFYMIPEGGSNELGIKGCTEIIQDIPVDFDIICVPAGTGATAAGVLMSLPAGRSVIAFQVLKAKGVIRKNIEKIIHTDGLLSHLDVKEEYHFNGYAKKNAELMEFISRFYEDHKIALDHVYTGKMMYGIMDLVRKGELRGKRVIAIHTGGMQGVKGSGESEK